MPGKKPKKVDGIKRVEKFIDSLPLDEQADAWLTLEQMENGELNATLYKTWRGKIKEVYFKKDNRIFFVVVGGTIHLLYACKKQKNKTPQKDADMVMKRARELQKLLGKKFI